MARKVGVDREQVVDAAATIADRDGLDGLSLARVAAAVGIRSPSLYAHVAGLDGLRRALRARGAQLLAAALSDAADGRRGADALHAFAGAYRAFATEHPGLYQATVRAAPADDPDLAAALLAPVTVVTTALADLGVGGDDALHAVRVLRSGLHGFVDLVARGGFGLPLDLDTTFDRLVAGLVVALTPAE